MDGRDEPTTDEIAGAIRSALTARDPGAFAPYLADDARWGSCIGRNQVVEYMRGISRDVNVEVEELVAHADRIIVALRVGGSPDPMYQVVFVRDGKIVELRGVGDRGATLTASPSSAPPPVPDVEASITGMATILPVRDLDRALAHYEALGFRVSPYDDGYGYAVRGSADLHLAVRPDLDPRRNASAVYLYVDDADALYAEWRAAGVEGQFFEPHDTEYGLCEGAHVDRDGNLLRFGSQVRT